MLNISKIVILFIAMIVAVGFFVGAICLQVHISKNNKRGKFVIPIIMFLMPFIMGVIVMAISVVSYNVHKVSPTTAIEVETAENILNEDGELIEGQDAVSDVEIIERSEGTAGTRTGAAIIMFPTIIGGALSFPCAIITLIIELVYRSKRKNITDEEVIDIQNL